MAQSTVFATESFQQPQYVEDLGAYRKGALHPVHIGDEIGGKYVIIDKLGHGDISTVWLATPVAQPGTCVALSVHMAEASEAAEARVVTRWSNLNKGDAGHPGKVNILLPQDWFTIQGPNGGHFCLVTPVAGQSVSAATKRDLIEGSRPLPLPIAKRVALGLVRGLQYSHSMKLAHGDLHPGNLLLGLPEDLATSATALSNLRGPPPIFPVPHQGDNRDAGGISRPSYLVEGIFAREMDPRMFSGAAKIGDWGDAFFDDDPPARTAWCGPYMTPEFNSPGSISMAEDVWMLGCAVFQMLTGRDLFGKKNDPSSKVLQAMVTLLGPPPDHFVADWRSYVEEMEGGPLSLTVESPTASLKQKVVESISQSHVPNMVYEQDLMNLGSLLESMFVWDPSQRLTIDEVANHAAMSFFLS